MTERPPHWPADVEPLDVEEFGKLGRNAKNEFFWDGQRLVTRNQYRLTFPQTLLALLAAVASLATIATGVNNASVYLCGRGNTWLGCPVAQVAPRSP